MLAGMGAGPYARLSAFYFFFFGSLGIVLPYWALYLQDRGFGPEQIGALVATHMVTKVVAPYLWGWVADRRGHRLGIIRLGALISALSFTGVFWPGGFWWMLWVSVSFSFFWNAILPQFEALTLTRLGSHIHHYASVRVWGSIGFIVTAVLLGWFFESRGISLVPLAIFVSFAGICLTTLLVQEPGADVGVRTGAPAPVGGVLRQPAVLALFAACFLNQASHGPYYGFFSIYMGEVGYGGEVIGMLWGVGVTAEVVLLLLMQRLLPALGAHMLLTAAFALTTLRWLLTAWYPDQLPVLLFAQTLHAFSFGVYHAAAIHLIHGWFRGSLMGRGQALYSGLSFGAGGALGTLVSGYLWEDVGAVWTFGAAALASLLAMLLAWRFVREAPEGGTVH